MNSPISVRYCEQCGGPTFGTGKRLSCWKCLLGGLDDEKGPLFEKAERIFQHYRLLTREDGTLWELGRGAMGVTYKAIDQNLHSVVALKVINAAFSSQQSARRRFLREARAAAGLFHPNIAAIFHFGETASPRPEGSEPGSIGEGDCFYAMEFVEGETLDSHLRRTGPLDFETALEIGVQVSRALMAAEKRALVHCDLKPSNIMLVSGSEPVAGGHGEAWVKVIDFGLAKAVSDAEMVEGIAASESVTGRTGFLGTPQFASPEQLAGGDVDVRSDIFSLGATLWYALTGELPFDGPSVNAVQSNQNERPVCRAHLEKTGASAPLIDLIASMLSADKARRPCSARVLLEALRACQDFARAGANGSPAEETRDRAAFQFFRSAQNALSGSYAAQSRYQDAIDLLQKAIGLDAGFVRAHAMLAEVHALMYRNSYDRSPARGEKVLTEAQTALCLSPKGGEAHRAMGIYDYYVRQDYERAREDFTRALRALPNDTDSLMDLGLVDCRQNRWEAALVCFQKAAELDPYRPEYSHHWWRTLAALRRYSEARTVLDQMISRAPEDIQLRLNRAFLSYSESADLGPLREVLAGLPGDYDPDGAITFIRWSIARYERNADEAERILASSPLMKFAGYVDGQLFPRQGLELLNAELRGDTGKKKAIAATVWPSIEALARATPEAPGSLMLAAIYLGILDRPAEAVEQGTRALAMLPPEKDGIDGPKLANQLIWVYVIVGQPEEAIRILEAYAAWPGGLSYGDLYWGVTYDPLRRDSRFQVLLGRLAANDRP